MGDGNVNYALAEPYSSKSSSYFGMNNQFDLFGKTVNLKGSTYRSFPMISDEPVKVKPKPKVTKKSLWAKIAVGMAVVGCVALVAAYGASLVFTGGASAVAAPYIVGTVAAIGGALFVNNKANEDIENQTESGWLSYMWAGAKGAYTGAEIGFAVVTVGQLAYGFLSALSAGGGGGSLAFAGAGGGTMSFALEGAIEAVSEGAIAVVVDGAIGLGIVSALEAVASGGGGGGSELHHIATDKNKKFDFKNHPAFKETGINVSKDVDNLVDLANHRGRHTYKYHQEIQDRLDAVVERYSGTDKLESAVRQELNTMKQELLNGKLDPYKK